MARSMIARGARRWRTLVSIAVCVLVVRLDRTVLNLGDRYGRKKVLLAALVIFSASSAACAFATSSRRWFGPGQRHAPGREGRHPWHSARLGLSRPSGRLRVAAVGGRPRGSGPHREPWPGG
jgi:hypothetical protein